MMKKKILFVMNNLNCGGAEKSLVSLLDNFDYDLYEVDLFLFKKEGFFLNQLSKNVTVLNSPIEFDYFDMSVFKSITKSILHLRFDIAYSRLISAFTLKKTNNASVKTQKLWKYISYTLKKQPKKYDVAVGYLENFPNNYIVEKVSAKKKIGFVHNDYNMLQLNKSLDYPYFNKLDYIVSISEVCVNILKDVFPDFSNKIKLLYNISSTETINKLANEKLDLVQNEIVLVSIGRLEEQKGFDFAINACKKLLDRNIKIKWYVLGEGSKRNYLEGLIQQNNLENNFFLLGLKENPYPYLKAASIYVQPSRYEGKSVAIDEAKILNKPIVVTNFESAKDQIENNVTGLIAQVNADAIANSIEKIILDETLKNKLVSNLEKLDFGTENEIIKFYKLLN